MDDVVRHFEKRSAGKRWYYKIHVRGQRLLQSWGQDGKRSGGRNRMTYSSHEQALREAEARIAKKLQDGFVEVEVDPTKLELPDPTARILDALGAKEPYQPVEGIPNCYHHSVKPDWFQSYLLLDEQGTRGMKVTALGNSCQREQLLRFVKHVRDHLHEFLAVEIVSVLPLTFPVAEFDRIAVVAAQVALPFPAYPEISESVGVVFPIYHCEFNGHETLVEAEQRLQNVERVRWNRKPSPAIDLRFHLIGVRGGRKDDKFVVHSENDLLFWLKKLHESKPGSFLQVRNWAMDILTLRKKKEGLEKELDGRVDAVTSDGLHDEVSQFVLR